MKNNLFVFNTNTLISSSISKNFQPRRAETKANRVGRIISSVATFSEFSEVFLRPKFDKYISRETRLRIISDFERLTIFFEIKETILDCHDPKDNKFLELAVSANAICIVSGDGDLLVLHPFLGIPILKAADFLNMF